MPRKRYNITVEADLELNMTAMIDIVFLLIIFFMTVTEMTKLDRIAGIQLPVANQAYVSDDIEADKVVINLHWDAGKSKRTVYYRNVPVSLEQLRNYLHIAAEKKRKAESAGGGLAPSDQAVVIRADRALPFRFVQDVMLECANEGLWKVSLMALQVER